MSLNREVLEHWIELLEFDERYGQTTKQSDMVLREMLLVRLDLIHEETREDG